MSKPPKSKHAMVTIGEYTVPLIGIPPDSVLTECDLCHDEFPQLEIELAGTQMLCKKCREEKK